ncbi:MAG: lectin [Betaproteobacteria bacterium]|nr:lectin [Betaproteobacteria bacterium]
MTTLTRHLTCISASVLLATAAVAAQAADMSFFATSVGLGKGADLDGLAGADKHCQSLAANAGAGKRTWRAYLSTQAADGAKAVNARERIGSGPWRNAKGVVIAKSVDDLHGDSNNLTKETVLSEKGEVINGRGDKPNRHDILTGTMPDGRAPTDEKNMTCGNWTQSGEGAALVGHHDRMGLRDDAASKSWNSSHASRGCSQEALRSSGGDGLLYCFAVK